MDLKKIVLQSDHTNIKNVKLALFIQHSPKFFEVREEELCNYLTPGLYECEW